MRVITSGSFSLQLSEIGKVEDGKLESIISVKFFTRLAGFKKEWKKNNFDDKLEALLKT